MAVALEGFKDTNETISADGRGRVTLGAEVKDTLFRVSRNEVGQILLTPVVTVPKHQAWLWQNQLAMASVQRGMQQAAQGDVHPADFSQYADLDIDD